MSSCQGREPGGVDLCSKLFSHSPADKDFMDIFTLAVSLRLQVLCSQK